MNSESPSRASAVLVPFFNGAATTEPPLDTVAAAKPRRGSAPPKLEPPPLRRLERVRAPLSSAQRRLWFLAQLNPDSALYNLALALRLRGTLVLRALQLSLDAVVARHEVLRTRFVSEEGEPMQVIDEATPLRLETLDFNAEIADVREQCLREAIATRSHEPFDLAHDRLLRATVVKLGPDEHVLLLVAHHIVVDGWSWHVLCRELSLHYKGFITEWTATLPELPVQYADYAVWRRDTLAGERYDKMLDYWRRQLAGAPEFLDLPTDRARPALPTSRGGTVAITLPASLGEALRQTGLREGATLFMTLLASFQVLLARYSRQTDIIVGAPIAGRTQVQLENLIGFFVNMLPMRTNLGGNPTFRDLLRQVRNVALDAYAHQELPFEKLVEELRPVRKAARPPIVQVAFVLQNTPGRDFKLPGLMSTPLEVWTDTAKLDLTLLVSEAANGTHVATLEYNADIYDRATAARMLGHWRTMLDAIAADSSQRIGLLPWLTPAERRQILFDWNNTGREYPRDANLHCLIAARAALAPDAVAIESGTTRITSGELEARANQLARRLAALGVARDSAVAVCLPRSPEMIVAWLAVLKAGGAYVPIDADYPRERREFMLQDSGARVVITRDAQSELFAGAAAEARTVVCLDRDAAEIAREPSTAPEREVAAENLAYICYTSGSTGQPKGVCVPHRAVLRLLLGANYFELEAGEGIAQLSNAAFDAATFEVWGALLHGARLVIVPSDVLLSPGEFAAAIERHRLTTMFITTGAFNQLSRHAPAIFRRVRLVLTGGEAASAACLHEVLRHGPPERLVNIYGPTECTTFATSYTVREVLPDALSVPIGRPISNTTAYVLDEHRRLVPVGVPGELYLGGDGVARGYHNRPDLTAEKFVADPFAQRPDARLYRTGDLVRWLPDGALEFLGRTDNQIKLRGFRIEPGEIEAVLARHEGVRECLVTVHCAAEDDSRLVAYVVPKSGARPAPEVLRDFLAAALPAHLVPSAVVLLDAWPLTPSGKVDRPALPPPNAAPAATGRDAPRTDLERSLVKAFASVLGLEHVGIHDGFFELGGHSLLAVRLVALIERTLGTKLPVAAVFQSPTVARLAEWFELSKKREPGDAFLTIQSHGDLPPLFLVHGVGGGMIWGYANLSRRLGVDQPVFVFRSRGLEGRPEPATIEGMAAQYVADLRAFQPHGPYRLAGYCFGGNVAYEMARQLQAQGEEVCFLGLFNSSPPNSSYDVFPWTPIGLCKAALNLRHTIHGILQWDAERRRQFLLWRVRTLRRHLARWFGPRKKSGGIDVEAMVDISNYSEFERRVWTSHVKALMSHQPQPYSGPVTLFRSPGHCVVSSYDDRFGWGDYVTGTLRVVVVPGAHESVLEEPHVATLARELAASLQEVRADRGGPRHSP
jgi:amino acid adenylation domain-containing protein